MRLKDVYWAEEGRSSVDAVVVATLFGGLIVLGIAPFDLRDSTPSLSLALTVALDIVLCVIVILKGKPLLALTGIFVPLVSMVGALRLANPRSPWARRWYAAGGRKLARARERYSRIERRRRRLLDAIGGTPNPG